MEIHPQEAGTRLCTKEQAESHAHSYVHTQRDTHTQQHNTMCIHIHTCTLYYTYMQQYTTLYTVVSSRMYSVPRGRQYTVVHYVVVDSLRVRACAPQLPGRGVVQKKTCAHALHTQHYHAPVIHAQHTAVCMHTHTQREAQYSSTHAQYTERGTAQQYTYMYTHNKLVLYTHMYTYTHIHLYTYIHTHLYVCIHTSIYVLYYTSHYYTIVILYYYYHNNTPIQKPYIGARTVLARLIGPIVDLAQKDLQKRGLNLCNFFSQNY